MFCKIVAAAAVVSVALCGAAGAADIAPRTSVYTSPTPVSMWDGIYVGIHGGHGWGDVDVRIAAAPGSGSPKGSFGGVQFGFNYMITPNWLVGSEVDASFGDISDNTAPFAPSNFEVDVFGTARGRLGYAHGPWLLYVTGGMAWAKPEWTVPGGVRNERAHVGWTGGLGVEYLFAPNWSVKAEYLYADFGETRRNVGGAVPVDTDLTMSMVRLGLNYHFGQIGSAASASTMPVKAPMRTAPRWTGAYVGIHGGYGFGDFDYSVVGAPGSLDPSGAFGGIQTGYNWQLAPTWMIGFETDSSWGAIKDSGAGDKIEIDAMGTVRGRLGYVMNNTLLYGTGGFAWAHLNDRTGVVVTSDRYVLGWTAGAGVEYQFAPRWSAKVEYAYMDFGTVSEIVGAAVLREKVDVHTVKVGLNYHASLLGLLLGR
jgi:outer membrane immunogenic protein